MALLERGECDVVGGKDIPMAAQSRPLKFDFFFLFFSYARSRRDHRHTLRRRRRLRAAVSEI
jgi:hypothetical protein